MARRKKYPKIANPKLAAGQAAIAFSNAWGTHLDKRYRRSRTRQNATGKAIKDYDG